MYDGNLGSARILPAGPGPLNRSRGAAVGESGRDDLWVSLWDTEGRVAGIDEGSEGYIV